MVVQNEKDVIVILTDNIKRISNVFESLNKDIKLVTSGSLH